MRLLSWISLMIAVVTGLAGLSFGPGFLALAPWTVFFFAVLFLIFFLLGLPEFRNQG